MKTKIFLAAALLSALSLSAQENKTVVIGATSWDDVPSECAPQNYGSSNEAIPINTSYYYSASQIVYSASELGLEEYNTIKGVSYMFNSQDYGLYTADIKVYLSESDLDAMEYDAASDDYKWFPVDVNATPNGTFFLDPWDFDVWESFQDMDNELEIVFDNPYVYRGKNLVVTVICEAYETYGDLASGANDLGFYTFDSKRYMAAAYCSDRSSFEEALAESDYLGDNGKQKRYEIPATKITYYPSTASVAEIAENSVAVSGLDGAVRVSVEEAARVAVYNLAGQAVADTVVGAGTVELPLAAGVYVVKVDGVAKKVIVK